MGETTEQETINPDAPQVSAKSLQQAYQEALLQSGIQAAKLLGELIDLKMMPDPRARETAEVALEVLRLVNSTSIVSSEQAPQPSDPE